MKCSLEDSNETSESISVVQPLTAQQTVTVDTVAKLESNSVVNTVLCDSSGDPTNENTSTSPTPSTHHRSGLSKFRFSKNKLTKVHLLLIYSIFLTFIVMFSILVWFLKDVFPLKNLVVTNDENRGGCVPMKVQYCIKHHVLYPFIMLPKDSNRSANQDMLSSKLADYDAILSVNCYSLLPLFLCSLLTPFCDANNQPVKPCRSFCKEAIRRCDFFLRVFSLEWPTQVDCDQYPDDPDPFICVGYRDNERYLKRNRVCNTDGFRCDGNRCLPQSWICDGFLDCKDKSDESNCSTCAAHQLYCGNGKCIDKSDICDGTRDCPDSRDERNCLRLRDSMGQKGEGRLEAWSAVDESWHNVCGEKWDQNFMSLKACRMLGYKHVKDTRIQDMSSTRLTSRISVNGRNSESKVMFYKGRERGCQKESNLSVYLRCTNFECGRSAINLNSNLRIVGGSESKPGQWPWLAGLHGGPAEVFFCGGVLISQRWVLSAAHCIGNQSDFSELTVKLGLTRRTSSPLFVRLYKVSQVIKHEGFNASNSYTNDIALLLLNESVNFDEFLKPVCLPNNEEDLKPGVECTVIGWGKSKHDKEADYLNVIHEVNVPLVNHSLCAQWYKLQDYTINEQMMLCAGYPEGKKDACQGDSGGPLLCRNSDQSWYVAGIVSWGVNCAQPELPGVYTNVKMYQEWIETVAQENGYPLSG